MLTRDPTLTDRLARRAENSRRYRVRKAQSQPWKTQWVLRSPVHVASFVNWMTSEGYLSDSVIHTREMLEEALTRYIADKINRHR